MLRDTGHSLRYNGISETTLLYLCCTVPRNRICGWGLKYQIDASRRCTKCIFPIQLAQTDKYGINKHLVGVSQTVVTGRVINYWPTAKVICFSSNLFNRFLRLNEVIVSYLWFYLSLAFHGTIHKIALGEMTILTARNLQCVRLSLDRASKFWGVVLLFRSCMI